MSNLFYNFIFLSQTQQQQQQKYPKIYIKQENKTDNLFGDKFHDLELFLFLSYYLYFLCVMNFCFLYIYL